MKQIKKRVQRGTYSTDTDDPFDLFVGSTQIRYLYYKDSHKILGNTFGMCVLQDFEALTPNLLARTIETVEGGGIVVLLLKTMKSLKQLYSITMDVHTRFRTESSGEVVGRFNERFLLSLASCANCIVVDDELNILPVSTKAKSIKAIAGVSVTSDKPEDDELRQLKLSLGETQFVGSLINTARTVDQARAILTFIDALCEKSLRTTVAITAARGRGKSAAMGVGLAYAIAIGYSNIFITSPSPENLKTLFEFIFKGFDVLEYKEHIDYEIVQSTNPEFNKAVIRVNFFREHRQTIQYIHPQDNARLSTAEIVVIDEAAAIPLPFVKKLLGPYLVFMASTINGYEGTGRALSLKLIEELRSKSGISIAKSTKPTDSEASKEVPVSSGGSGRMLKEVAMKKPIRYAQNDPVESWLNELLCMDTTVVKPIAHPGCPPPQQCTLFYVNRDTLFSYHKASEQFLQRIMSLYVSSHYKNTPDDLLLISDAPAHHLFVLLGPVDSRSTDLPEVLTVLQVCIEGSLARETVTKSLAQGRRGHGDLIPWTVSQQYQDDDFPGLSGVRIVRIATHQNYQGMGYGTRAIDLLKQYYKGEFIALDEDEEVKNVDTKIANKNAEDSEDVLGTEVLKPRSNLPPLLLRLDERKPESLQWMGTSYGLTEQLFSFWSRNEFIPVYVRQTANELTGEHSCIMLSALPTSSRNVTADMDYKQDWLQSYYQDFKRRYLSLLSFEFTNFPASLVIKMTMLNSNTYSASSSELLTKQELDVFMSPYDLKRLETYSARLLDYHAILDLVPTLARLFFLNKLRLSGDMMFDHLEYAVLIGVGLQHKNLENMIKEVGLPPHQVMSAFNKVVKILIAELRNVEERGIGESIQETRKQELEAKGVEEKRKSEELEDGGESGADRVTRQMDMMEAFGEEYKIKGTDEDWQRDLGDGADRKKIPSSISIRTVGDKEKRSNREIKNSKEARNSAGAAGAKKGGSGKTQSKKRKRASK